MASATWLMLMLAPVPDACAQDFSIDRYTIAGGGGTSTSGPFTITGTAGQPEAGGHMTNGQYSVTGGFWALPIPVQSADAPRLEIVAGPSGQAIISWKPATPGFVLQESRGQEWSNSPSGATNPVVVPATLRVKFYRLVRP